MKPNIITKAYLGLINLVYPLTCGACDCYVSAFENKFLCPACQTRIKHNLPPFCPTCAKPLPAEDNNAIIALSPCRDCRQDKFYYDRVWSACIYEGVIRQCLKEIKYRANPRLLRQLAEIMINFAGTRIPLRDFQVITSVPIHPRKQFSRGFNQSQILGKQLASFYRIPWQPLLVRVRSTLPQNQLSRRQREQNVKDVFAVKNKNIRGKKILLIDDIFTTGATVNECSRVLKQAGAAQVCVFALSRGY